jgi:hypothetical protein
MNNKPRVIKDFEKLDGEIQEKIKLSYPNGFAESLIYYQDKEGNKIMATNSMLVKRAVDAVKAYGNEIATPIEARKMLGIPEFIH